MRLYDPDGVYTPEEVQAALEASTGSRSLQFKFERLTYRNESLGFIDYVADAEITNNMLADIKRKASFTVRDTGELNYLSDRIKPYVGVRMPDGEYVWWPQGVFLLSTPSRTYESGSAIFRDIDGYDQLLVLTDDKVPSRYTALAGALYTDEIRKIIGTPVINWAADPNAVTGTATGGTWGRIGSPTHNDDPNVTAPYGGYSYYIQTTGASGEGAYGQSVLGTFEGRYHTSMWIKGPVGESWRVSGRTAGTGISGLGARTYVTNGSWQRVDIGFVVGAGTTRIGLQIEQVIPSSGKRLDMNGLLLTQGAVLYDFFAGGINDGFWNGTANLSTSTWYEPMFDSVIAPSTLTIPVSMEWEPGTPKLTVLNDLLSALNYDSASFDEDGRLICQPYRAPADRPGEYIYSVGEQSLISGDVEQTLDLFDVANKWVLVVSDPDLPPMSAEYTNTSLSSPTSTVNRGRTILDFRKEEDAADQTTLNAKVARLAAEASQVYEIIEFETMLMPVHSNSDVYFLQIEGIDVNSKYSEHEWSMPLRAGAMMSHRVRRVVKV